ncbi:EF hand domain protein [Fimbriimonas ginsengisoli Gsoil 348]|uniref:EF hand domain protein n=1 Tax=Fimbriimonas ginsengisoli Gsoil 348 TaxID=661478 RepID=A0A068NKW3_FIMGI|nr:EF hand domain protein [Fimbriimonas ginsengisoli Gsoil 348]
MRLTPEGSTWLWNYNKARKVSAPPTADAQPANDEQKGWEAWVSARIARDRWLAWQQAIRSNQKVLGKPLPVVDKDTPATEPADPGPIPPTLAALAGNPPAFAAAVVPMQHDIRFDDASLTYQDNFRIWNQRYPYYRYGQGVASGGTAVKSIPSDRLDHLFRLAGISDAEAKVMRSVSMLEGGFDSINTYDTGFVSIGFIQFACLKEGAGSLGGMLLSYRAANPTQYQKDFRDFGLDVTPTGSLAVLDLATGAELHGPDAAKKIIDDKRYIAVFQRAGQRSDPFVAAQIKAAKTMYYPGDDPISVTLEGQTVTGKVSDVIRSEAGMATLMDRKVNTGSIASLGSVLNEVVATVRPKSLAELAKYEYEIIDRMRYRTNYLADSSLSQPTASRVSNGASRGGGRRRGGKHRR